MPNIYNKLLYIQTELKAPKNQYNSFGKYHYRSCEDILEGLKPLLAKCKAAVTISDEIILVGDRYYIKATATLFDAEFDAEKNEKISVSAYAREDESKKGMDLSQLTGCTSSYARKYALNGLFAIDDTRDSDYLNNHKEQKQRANKPKSKSSMTDLATNKQLNYMYQLQKSKNIKPEYLQKIIQDNYKKDSSKKLTKFEATELIGILKGTKKEPTDYEKFVQDFKQVCNEIEKEHSYEDVGDVSMENNLKGTPFEK